MKTILKEIKSPIGTPSFFKLVEPVTEEDFELVLGEIKVVDFMSKGKKHYNFKKPLRYDMSEALLHALEIERLAKSSIWENHSQQAPETRSKGDNYFGSESIHHIEHTDGLILEEVTRAKDEEMTNKLKEDSASDIANKVERCNSNFMRFVRKKNEHSFQELLQNLDNSYMISKMEIDLLELDVFQEYMEKYGEKTDEIDKIDVEIEELTVQLRELRGKKEGLQKEQSQLTLNLNCDLFGEKLKEIAEDIKTDETQSNVLQFSSMLLSVIDDKDLDAVTGILSDIERAIKRKRYLW
jgi:hypothetical protein